MAGKLTEKYGTKSPVWKHFGLMTDENGGGIQPDSPVPNLWSSSTSENWQHLELAVALEK